MEEPHTAFPADGMKILYYSPHPSLKLHAPTGYGTHMREMIRAFEELGHEVKFFIGGETTSTQAHETVRSDVPRKSPMKTILKMITPKVIWETVKDLQLIRIDQQRRKSLDRICSEFEPDVIYERSHYGMVSGVIIARKHAIHHVLEVNSPNVQERIQLSGPSWLSERATKSDNWVFAQSNHVLTVSTRLAEMLDIHRISQNWSVTPNAIRPGQELPTTNLKTRSNLGIDDSVFLVGFIGSIFKWHGVHLLIDAIAMLRNENIDVAALIVGDGSIKNELVLRSVDKKVENHVFWTGSVPHDEIHGLGRLCDCLIMPKSDEYRSPVKLFEYALCDRPVIAPNQLPVLEVMEDQIHGLIVSADENEISKAIVHLLKNKLVAEELAGNWRKKVMNYHTWRQNAIKALMLAPQNTAVPKS